MLIKLNHQNLEVYKGVRELSKEIYQLSSKLPADERFNMIQQIRPAGLSIKLNLAEGSSRKSTIEDLTLVAGLLNKFFAMLSNMIK